MLTHKALMELISSNLHSFLKRLAKICQFRCLRQKFAQEALLSLENPSNH